MNYSYIFIHTCDKDVCISVCVFYVIVYHLLGKTCMEYTTIYMSDSDRGTAIKLVKLISDTWVWWCFYVVILFEIPYDDYSNMSWCYFSYISAGPPTLPVY